MSHSLDRAELEDRLWKEIADARFGMLGLAGEGHHLQPMACYADRTEGAVWFFTKRANDLVRESGGGRPALFCVVSKDQEFQACLTGTLIEDFEPEKVKTYWSPVVAAWYPDGQDDPDLTLLRFTAEDAQLWVSRSGPLRFAWEIARANATKSVPDLGDTAKLTL
jgi:general stress protein 26